MRSDLRDFNRAILIRPMACIMWIEMCYGRIWGYVRPRLEAKQIEAQTLSALDGWVDCHMYTYGEKPEANDLKTGTGRRRGDGQLSE